MKVVRRKRCTISDSSYDEFPARHSAYSPVVALAGVSVGCSEPLLPTQQPHHSAGQVRVANPRGAIHR